MSGFWRVSVSSTGAAKAEKMVPIPGAGEGPRKQTWPRLLGYEAYVYVGTTGAAVDLSLNEGVSSAVNISSAVVATVGRATEMQPARAYSKAGLAHAPYIALAFSASAGTEVINMYGDYA